MYNYDDVLIVCVQHSHIYIIYTGQLSRKDARYSKTVSTIRAVCVMIVKWNKPNDIDTHDKVSII